MCSLEMMKALLAGKSRTCQDGDAGPGEATEGLGLELVYLGLQRRAKPGWQSLRVMAQISSNLDFSHLFRSCHPTW